jgi:peptidyl-dipeptidase Dcp
LICNFQQVEKSGHKLISYENLNTFLHEMGHLLHAMSCQVPYDALYMTHVANDFVEIPSQFLENLLGEEKTLKQYIRHYKTGKSMKVRGAADSKRKRKFLFG